MRWRFRVAPPGEIVRPLVIVVDPDDEHIVLHDASEPRSLKAGATLTHDSLPGFSLDAATRFERGKRG
jgi:hypothetical protein